MESEQASDTGCVPYCTCDMGRCADRRTALAGARGEVLDDPLVFSSPELVTGIAPDVLESLVSLYSQWAAEEDRPYDPEFFASCLVRMASEGSLVPVVAFETCVDPGASVGQPEAYLKPVGCVLLFLYRDHFSGMRCGMVDHLYVVPENRGSFLGIELGQAANAMCDFFDVQKRRVPAKPETANYYWRNLPAGYRLDTVIFTRG